MKNILILLLTAIAAVTANASPTGTTNRPTPPKTVGSVTATNQPPSQPLKGLRAIGVVKSPVQPEFLYGDNELTLDLAATYTAAEPRGIDKVFDTNARHGKFGASLGVTKFFTYSLGLGAEVGISNLEHINAIDYLNVIGVCRLPFERFAPYLVAGVGRELHAGIYDGIAGAGLEYRFTPKLGAFAEARFIFREAAPDAGMARLGVRFVF